MSQVRWISDEEMSAAERMDEELLLAAALAATLVAYRRHAGQVTPEASRHSNWQTVARWEQLRGRA
jgi:hypothetical protein